MVSEVEKITESQNSSEKVKIYEISEFHHSRKDSCVRACMEKNKTGIENFHREKYSESWIIGKKITFIGVVYCRDPGFSELFPGTEYN